MLKNGVSASRSSLMRHITALNEMVMSMRNICATLQTYFCRERIIVLRAMASTMGSWESVGGREGEMG